MLDEIRREVELYIINEKDVKEFELRKEGAKGVKVKYLLHAGIGAKNIQLRIFTIEPKGSTPQEQHEHEHEVFILEGKGKILSKDKEFIIKEGDAVFIESFEPHKIENIGDTPLRFLCTKQTSELPKELKQE